MNVEGRLIPGGELADAEIPSADRVHGECRTSAAAASARGRVLRERRGKI